MKKLYIVILLCITTLLSINFVSVKALNQVTLDIDTTWVDYNNYSTYYSMRLEKEYILDYTRYINMKIPQTDYSLATSGGITSSLVLFDDTDAILAMYELEDFLGEEMYGTINIDINNNIIYGRVYYYYESTFSFRLIDSIQYYVMQDYTSIPSDYYAYWVENSIFTITTYLTPVYFMSFDGSNFNKLYDSQYVYNEELPTKPVDPVLMPTLDSYFIGWRTIEGVLYDFQSPITDNMLNEDNILILYASYAGINVVTDPDNTIEDNTTEGLNNILSVFGLNNDEGFMILFVIINLIIITLVLILKLPSLIGLILGVFTFGVFIFLGVLEIYVIIIMTLVYVVFLLGNFKRDTGEAQ